MADIKLLNTYSGADIEFNGSDLVNTDGWENMPFLGIFGGNVESSTKEFEANEQRFDWWGNNLLMPNNSVIQINSDLERLLRNIALNTSGRLQIEDTIKSDLRFMEAFANLNVETYIVSDDVLKITIKIQEPSNLESKEFVYIWDNTIIDDSSDDENISPDTLGPSTITGLVIGEGTPPSTITGLTIENE